MATNVSLILYYQADGKPLRDTIEKHLHCFRQFALVQPVYINLYFPFPTKLVQKLHIQYVIFHTTLLSAIRWSTDDSILVNCLNKLETLKSLNCPKAILPQDEFINNTRINRLISELHISHIFTVAPDPNDWPRIYGELLTKRSIAIATVLTGYIDEHSTAHWQNKARQSNNRPLDFGYRAYRADFNFGLHGLHKIGVGEHVLAISAQLGLKVDISFAPEATFLGKAWFEFLLQCKGTLGCESGVSMLDHDGSIRARVQSYLGRAPNATFTEVEAACFPGLDNSLNLLTISPRHFEAMMTNTTQFLVEGRYNELLRPWRHYIPIKKDYSDILPQISLVRDAKMMKDINEKCAHEILNNPELTYAYFVQFIEKTLQIHSTLKQRVLRLPAIRLAGRNQGHWLKLRIKEKLPKLVLLVRLLKNTMLKCRLLGMIKK